MAKYQNGYIVYDGQAHEKGYPAEWLRATKEYEQFKAPHSQFDLLQKRMTDFQKFADKIVNHQHPDVEEYSNPVYI